MSLGTRSTPTVAPGCRWESVGAKYSVLVRGKLGCVVSEMALFLSRRVSEESIPEFGLPFQVRLRRVQPCSAPIGDAVGLSGGPRPPGPG